MEQMEKDLKYAQQLINVLQTKLNDSVALNIQLEAKLLTLQEEAKETTTKTDTKPKATIAPPQQNIAGQGGVAETGLSTLKQVQVGAS